MSQRKFFLILTLTSWQSTSAWKKNGAERGSSNEPASSAVGFDDVELAVIERIQEEKKTVAQSVEDEMLAFSERLTNLDFDGQFVMIKQANATAVTDYVAEVQAGLDELHGLRRAPDDAEKERADFQKTQKIVRAPRTQSTGFLILKIMFLVLCVITETVFNGSFLAGGNEEGLVGGVTVAAGFSFLNIGAATLAAFLVKNFRHRSIVRKFIGIIAFPLYLGFAGLINLALGHYRETSQVPLGGAGQEVIRRLTETPFHLNDIQSWILTGVGIAFSIGAFIDASTIGDPYLGYSGVEIRLQRRRDAYVDARQELIDRLRDVRDDYSSKITEIVRDLAARKREYDAIISHRTRIIHLFDEHQDQLERAANVLLGRYRNTNRSARSTPPPTYFADGYKLQRSPQGQKTIGELNDSELSASIKNAQEELIEQARRMAREFETAVGTAVIFGITTLSAAIFLSVAAFSYYKWIASHRVALDPHTNCPVTGPVSATAVLLDVSVAISQATLEDLRNKFDTLAARIPKGGLISIYGLTSRAGDLRPLFTECNPGDGSDTDPITSNPRLAKQRWEEGYRNPFDEFGKAIGTGKPTTRNPIMAAIQHIELTFFDAYPAQVEKIC